MGPSKVYVWETLDYMSALSPANPSCVRKQPESSPGMADPATTNENICVGR